MKRPLPRNLLWICWLPFSILALGMVLDRTHPLPRRIPSSDHFWSRVGAQAYNAGDLQRAIPFLALAAAENELQPEGWLMLGDAYQAAGDPQSALWAWQNTGDSPAALERRLNAHRRLQDYPAAIADLQTLIALQPEQSSWVYQLGLLLAATQPDQAVETLARAAALSSSYTRPVRALQPRIQAAQPAGQLAYTLLEAGRGLADLNEWALAAEAFRRATLLRPDYVEAWAFLGEALQHINIPEGKDFSPAGLSELERAVQLDPCGRCRYRSPCPQVDLPCSLSASLFTALYWRRQGLFRLAQQSLETLAARDEQNPVIQVELGNILAEKGDFKAALLHYSRATALAPGEPRYWQALVEFSMRSQYQVRQVALPAARQLLQLTPTDPAALDLMGQALYLLDDPLNAERFFRRSIQSDSGYSPAHLHLAQVYLLRSATAAARQELSLAVSLAPGSPSAEYAQRLLQSAFP